MRKEILPLAIFAALLSCGCLYTDIRVPRAYRSSTPADVQAKDSDPNVSGKSCYRSALYLVAWGNGGYAAAVQDALKDQPDAVLYDVKVDIQARSLAMGLYSRACTVVTGRAGTP